MEKRYETPRPLRLDVRAPAGEVVLEAAETSETVVRIDAADDVLEAVVVEQRGDGLRVEVPHRKGISWLRGAGPDADVIVRCPVGSSAQVRVRSADVVARGPFADVDVGSASGDVLLELVAGDATVQTASGDVRIGRVDGAAALTTASGDVRAERVGGRLRASVVSGDLRVCAADDGVEVTSVSGDVRLESVASGAVSIQSVSGDVEVGIRRGSRVHVDAATLSGDPISELELGADPGDDEGPLVELRINTVSGDVRVVRATTEEVSR